MDRDPISGALYSGALTLDPLWNTSERCAGGDLGITARLLFTVPVQAACVFHRRHGRCLAQISCNWIRFAGDV